MASWRCKLGWHKWWTTGERSRACMRCEKRQYHTDFIDYNWDAWYTVESRKWEDITE